jgi:DNA-binding PadR family transcriptional regulator
MARLTWQMQAILATLLQDPTKPHYGLEMAKAAGLPSGTIYPMLARFERNGWVESELEDIDVSVAGRRPRRYYRLTGEGERLAEAEIAHTVKRLQPAARRARRSGAPSRPAGGMARA